MSFADELKETKTYDEMDWEDFIKGFYSYIKEKCRSSARCGYNSTGVNSKDFCNVCEDYNVSEDNPNVKKEFDNEEEAKIVLDLIQELLANDGIKIVDATIHRGKSYGHEVKIAKQRSQTDARVVSAMNFLLGSKEDPNTYYKKDWVIDGYRFYFTLELAW